MKTQKEKMLAGELYIPFDTDLTAMRSACRAVFREYNAKPSPELLEKLFNKKLKNVHVEPPFYCDYGLNITLGENVYMNFNCIILDCAEVKIGDNTLLAPNVQIYTAAHPLDVQTRNSGKEFAKPVTIGKNCWIGGGAVILPGVTIGDNCTIGAGSVVTKDIPPSTLAVGNPCKVIKYLNI
ncbi:MAG: sugar O-acetyltransferase [Candidatus Gastranaerophilales bacterium]|nr:sugar O-acetyltransferase [Candidatus Gastranaerophilales bacterium]